PYGGTFLTFTDYCRPAIRLSALMELGVVYVMTHDSIGLGEDGPTHQPIEHLAALRAIPRLRVFPGRRGRDRRVLGAGAALARGAVGARPDPPAGAAAAHRGGRREPLGEGRLRARRGGRRAARDAARQRLRGGDRDGGPRAAGAAGGAGGGGVDAVLGIVRGGERGLPPRGAGHGAAGGGRGGGAVRLGTLARR